MNNAKDNFSFDLSKAVANNESIIKGDNYRITVITESLIRLEYSNSGSFEDHPTERIWYRNFNKPNFTIEDKDGYLRVTTKYFELLYKKETPFSGGKLNPTKNLKIMLKNTDRVWYYGHPEIRNYNTEAYYNNKASSKIKSLLSLDGFSTIDDSASFIYTPDGSLQKRSNNEIDIYVFLYNKDFYNCLNDYFMVTGSSFLIPRYLLGNIWDKKECYNSNDIVNLIKQFDHNDIPISSLLLNNWNNIRDYSLRKEFGDYKSLVNYLHSKNIKIGLTLDNFNYFYKGTVSHNLMKKYLKQDSNGNLPFNVYDLNYVRAFIKEIINTYDSIGTDFYSLNNYNIYNSYLNHYLYLNDLNNKRPVIMNYNYGICPHRDSIIYGGKKIVSFDSLTDIVKYNLSNFGSGISYYTHDFGGSKDGIEDNELFVRYIQLGVFSPILKLGSEGGKYYKRAPWDWGIKTFIIASNYLKLRYKLIPYIYTELYKYYKYGKPLIEPVYYRNPDIYDDSLYNNEYYFGDNIFVSPILNKKDYIMNRVIHKLYIPDGIWYDYFSGKKYNGNKKYVSFYKDEEYPVFVKAGSIIPISLNKLNDTGIPKDLELQIFPGNNNSYSIYEDDGVTNNYKNGDYLITNVEYIYRENNYSLTILPVQGKTDIVPKTRNYSIRFKNTKPVSRILSYVGSKEVKNSSYEDGKDLVIQVLDIPTNTQFTLVCGGENIQVDALSIINEDISSIISDLPIKTSLKEKIDSIMFSPNLPLKKKRIEIRKLGSGKDYLERKYVDLFLKLLEYISEV